MKANEFIKNFGWKKAKEVIVLGNKYAENGILKLETFCGDEMDVNVSELKSLVDSFNLIGSYGGLNGAKVHLLSVKYESRLILEQAIKDVESCK